MRKWVLLGMALLLTAEVYIGVTDLFPGQERGTVILTVPELTGGTIPDGGDFEYTVAYRLDESVAPGTVLEQRPAAGTRIKVLPGDPAPDVTLIAARGRMEYTVRDYAGRDFREVREELTAQGFRVNVAGVEGDPDRVAGTRPARGETVAEGGEITIYYGESAGIATVMIPELYDMPLTDAVRELLASGLYLGDIERVSSDETPEGCVIAHTPPAGAYMPYRSRVKLYVSTGGDVNEIQNKGTTDEIQ